MFLTTILTGVLLAGCFGESGLMNGELPMAPESDAQLARRNLTMPPAAAFVAEIDNPYLAFERGKTFRYEGETDEGLETIVVEVTHDTKMILGVAATVVRDRVYLDGELIEDTLDWFAQDLDGNVWYLGEDVKDYEDGVLVSTAGSFEAGVNGAEAGIAMLAHPKSGMAYAQEFAPGEAEDQARILGVRAAVEVAFGNFEGCLHTMEWTPLEPGHREHKFYAPGLGKVLGTHPRGGNGRTELVSVEY
jgi:hypothetical protein